MVYFADTAFWVALLNSRDEHHQRARAWQRFIRDGSHRVVTTQPVLWEMLDALAVEPTRATALALYRGCIARAEVEGVEFSPTLIAGALRLYGDRPDKGWGITDCNSFLVMSAHGVADALTADRDFVQAGFNALLRVDPPLK